ncbi:hypothetical protein BKM31_55305 [[Actinomadura] parvosata subsp. kistnae]|uniref:Uncharacterized protein n=1 Tax=[Actinomadura] parvosata subsp. kistnae TaxID=1909395 RepID=A0A1V0AGS3_9ACTN|nr:hypothetical protein BKM31_55305 [Nonomuraea sp. ATCC 55076]
MAGLMGISRARTAAFSAVRKVAWIRTTVAGDNRRPVGEGRDASVASSPLTSREVSWWSRIRPSCGMR